MPVIRSIPDSKRRSRTGCLPCRKRRRKCNEKRPQCGSCEDRNVTCEYKEWAFVPGVHSSLNNKDTIRSEHEDAIESPAFAQGDLLSFSKPTSPDQPADESPHSLAYSVTENTARPLAFAASPIVSIGSHELGTNQVLTPLKWNEAVASDQGKCSKQRAMHCFRYQVVPWIDSNAPKSSFGSKVMALAQEKPIIMDAATYLAKCWIRGAEPTSEEQPLQELQNRLLLEDAFIVDVGQSLLALGGLFDAGPSHWTNICLYHVQSDAPSQPFEDVDEPLKTLLRFHMKIVGNSGIILVEMGSVVQLMDKLHAMVPGSAPRNGTSPGEPQYRHQRDYHSGFAISSGYLHQRDFSPGQPHHASILPSPSYLQAKTDKTIEVSASSGF
ncbi:hypothetical protein AK830_g96 [Neonectria ditissima]|uniref:Zn(2)-C6 fungal-type domain-containing protein n=1 Tax=Neonectria ditissima TaxID=78410 RepID=A0A0P7B879_9HYPO|nr:hypothetical protein AK830_g96 [Neonectria ditissima]